MSDLTRRQFFLLALAASSLPLHLKAAFAREMTNEMHGMVPTRVLGKTGEKVSMIGLGGWHMGAPGEEEGIRLTRTAIDNGITFMDNCWDYHDGGSEERMGRALRNGYRDRVFLMSKIDGRTRQSAARQIEDSLKRLQTDRIDLMQIHEVIRPNDPELCFGPGGTMEALVAARKAGKIRYIGFTGHKSPAMHLKMLEVADKNGFDFDAVQLPLNVMDASYDSFEKKVLPVLLKKNIGVLAMKTLGGGILLQSGTVTAQECLRYALSLPVSVVITGCESMRILQQALQVAMNFEPLTQKERIALIKRNIPPALEGKFEKYKTSTMFDGTTRRPEWLGLET